MLPPVQPGFTRKSRSAHRIEPFTNGREAWMFRWSIVHLFWKAKVPFSVTGPLRLASAPNSVTNRGLPG